MATVEVDKHHFNREFRLDWTSSEPELTVVLAHPDGAPDRSACIISTRLSIDDRRLTAVVRELQDEWATRFGVRFPRVGKTLRASSGSDPNTNPSIESALPTVEVDCVSYDSILERCSPSDDVWLRIALVHPKGLPLRYRCVVTTRFHLVDKRVRTEIRKAQEGWDYAQGTSFVLGRDLKPYVHLFRSGKTRRAYGVSSRFRLVQSTAFVYRYLEFIADFWARFGSEPSLSASQIRHKVLQEGGDGVDALFSNATTKKIDKTPSHLRPCLSVELVGRVGERLGYISRQGVRVRPRGRRCRTGPVDRRLLPLVASILAQAYREPAAKLLRTVVEPALLRNEFDGFMIDSTEHQVAAMNSARSVKRSPRQRRK